MNNKLERKYGLFTAICMVVGIVIGIVGMGMALLNYPIYKGILKRRKKKYGAEILALSEKIMNR